MTFQTISGETIMHNDAHLRALDAEIAALADEELAVLRALREDWGWYLPRLAEEAGINLDAARRARIALRDKGLAYIASVWNDDDGLLRGSTYFLTRRGAQLYSRDEWLRIDARALKEAGPRITSGVTGEGEADG